MGPTAGQNVDVWNHESDSANLTKLELIIIDYSVASIPNSQGSFWKMWERLIKQNLFFINNKNCANNWLLVKLWTTTSYFFSFHLLFCTKCLATLFSVLEFLFLDSSCSQLFQSWPVSYWRSRSPEATPFGFLFPNQWYMVCLESDFHLPNIVDVTDDFAA